MKNLLLVLFTLVSFNVLAEKGDPKDMNLDNKFIMYDCLRNDRVQDICYTKDNMDTYTIEGEYLGFGDYTDFMVPNGTMYGVDSELPEGVQVYRNYVRDENGL